MFFSIQMEKAVRFGQPFLLFLPMKMRFSGVFLKIFEKIGNFTYGCIVFYF